MTDRLQGIVTKTVGGVFTVYCEGKTYSCFAPKKLRFNNSDVIVGDKVVFTPTERGRGIVSQVLERKNKMLRPEIANVDVALIVVACQPLPDLLLVDKILVNCFKENIMPVIVVNKTDISDSIIGTITENYGNIAEIVTLSANCENVGNVLGKYIENNVVCFAGQSAVGKTSLLNALIPTANGETGELSAKTGRGKHTTRHTRIFPVFNGFLADTCGFSLCNIEDIRATDLHLYLDDMMQLSHACKYSSCTHTAEPDCAVKKAVEQGNLCKQRYERYVEEYNQLREYEKNRY